MNVKFGYVLHFKLQKFLKNTYASAFRTSIKYNLYDI